MKQLYAIFLCACCLPLVSSAQIVSHVKNLVNTSFSLQKKTTKLRPFEVLETTSAAAKSINKHAATSLKNYTVLKLAGNYKTLQNQATLSKNLQFSVPVASLKTATLNLVHNQITAPGFFVITSDGKIINDPAGVNDHFLGIAEGSDNSLAAISFTPSGITGFFSGKQGNTVIETAGNGLQIMYNDNDVIAKLKTTCTVNDSDFIYTSFKKAGVSINQATLSCKTVKMYVECSYSMYLSHGANIDSVINFVFTLFNATSAIFKNDGINIQLSEIFVWSQPDIYSGITFTGNLAMALQNRLRQEYEAGLAVNADIAHLITNQNFSGGAATGIGIINNCGKENGLLTAAASSSIRAFPALPAFSFAVFTFAHETGHMLGSPHTQSCSWPGGAIDDCALPEGACAAGPPPTTGGTIMSYCYNSPYGVNFLNGFGPLPSALIRDQIERIPCISSCEDTICSNVKLRGVDITINTTSLKLKWIKEAVKYKIGVKPNTTQQWKYYEVINADSFVIVKTSCESLYEFSIAPFCSALNHYGITYTSSIGDPNAIKLAFTNIGSNGFCPGDSVMLTVNPDSNFVYSWYLNGLLQPAFNTRIISVKAAGNYNVVALKNGCNYYSDTIKIIKFSQNPNIQRAVINDLNVVFTGVSSCSKTVLWDFGDGFQSTANNPAHLYAQKGIYKVSYKVWDASGSMESTQKTINLLYEEYIDSLNGATQFGQSVAVNYTDFACRSVAFFNADTLIKNGSGTVIASPFLRYLPGIGNTFFPAPKTGTIEFKLYPQRGLIKVRGNYTDVLQSDTGYVLNVSFSVTNERNTFFLNFSKWGGLQVAVDSVVLGNIANGVAGPLRLNEWNNIGISYGDKGIHVMLNGQLFASDPHVIDSAHAALLGRFHFGTHIGRIVGYGAATVYFKSFEGALDMVRLSHRQKDFTFSSAIAWQGKDSVTVRKQLCAGDSFEGHNKTTTYFKKNTTAEGCDSITTINLKVNEHITITDSVLHPLGANKGAITIKNIFGGALPYKFSWSTGDTTQNLNDILPGNYVLKIKDSIGCEQEFVYNLYQLNGNKDLIVLLPNPATENKKITVRIGTATAKNYNCIIYDITGRKRGEQKIQANFGVTDIPLSAKLHKGIYVLHLTSQAEKRSIKFIVN